MVLVVVVDLQKIILLDTKIKKRIIIIIIIVYFYKVDQPRNYLIFEFDIKNLKFKRYYIHIL
jgi:hypothetical protein